MEDQGLYYLKIDKGFRALIRPPQKAAYLKLEQQILAEGCKEPICVWDGFIIDGHNRYHICTRHKIPFSVRELPFTNRDEAIVWICTHQLDHKDLSEEMRKYLIGSLFEAEKRANSQRASKEFNRALQEEAASPYLPDDIDPFRMPTFQLTAQRIAEKYHVAWNTVNKYATYAKALEEVRQKAPDALLQILSGKYKISHNNVIELARLSPEHIKQVMSRFELNQQPYVKYKSTRREIQETTEAAIEPALAPPQSIKDMPVYDPDSEIIALALTIPSWVGTINRARTSSDLSKVSPQAKEKLRLALKDLQRGISRMLHLIKED